MIHLEGSSPKLVDPDRLFHSSTPFWARALYRLRWITALLSAGLCLYLVLVAKGVGVDSTNHPFFIRDDKTWYEFEQFKRKFGAADNIVVGVELPDGLSPDAALQLDALEKELGKIPDVADVLGISKTQEYEMGWFGQIKEKALLGPLLEKKESTDALFARRKEWPPQAQHLLSSDGHLAVMVLSVRSGANAADGALSVTRQTLEKNLAPGTRFILTGSAVEQNVFTEKIEKDRRTFVPLCVGVIIVLLLLFHLDFGTLIYGLLVMGGSLAATEALMALLHVKMHALTSLLAPVILIVAVSSTVKVSGVFSLTRATLSPSLRLANAFRAMFLPCFLANLTTFIGFLALTVSHIPAVKDFGLFGAIGTTAAWLLTMLWAPLFEAWAPKPKPHRMNIFEKAGSGISWLARKASWAILLAAAMFITFCVVEIPLIRTSTEFIKIFHSDDPFRKDTEFMLEKMGGIYPLEVVLETPSLSQMRLPETWNKLDAFETAISALPGASHAVGLTSFVRYFEKVVRRPRDEKILGKILDELPKKMGDNFKELATEGCEKLRFTLFMENTDSGMVANLARNIPELARQKLGEGWEVVVTGENRLLTEMSERLVRDEVISVLTAFGIILILIVVMIRSVPYALLGVVPNFVPIAGLFGAMSYLGIGLNTATAMIASVAIGLVFDNTVYILYGYREARAKGLDADKAVTEALSTRFKPVIASSLILAGGFGVTTFGHMIPTVQFGLLSCITIGLATLSDLFVLPALLHIFKPK